MYDLREALVGAGPKPRLISMPLIQVVGHQWYIYFVCDRGTLLDGYGPVSLGFMESTTSTYVLLISLEAIKTWMLGTFASSLCAWFVCDEDENEDHRAEGST